ncbi:hypothetical protein S122051_1416 [Staphylococcus aureus subsp. aureus 122051]|nr:hypothetical protein S122051_1416 [Staphylococcus aureus subsp. aureus 122051]
MQVGVGPNTEADGKSAYKQCASWGGPKHKDILFL